MLQPISNKHLNFIVVGTGRCGTVYFAKLLTAVGIPCGHERIFTWEGLSRGNSNSDVAKWSGLDKEGFVMADASFMAVPFLKHNVLKGATIIHIVRDPIKVIMSFHNKLQYGFHEKNKWEKFIYKHLPALNNYETPLAKNCYYVVRWNEWIEQSNNRQYIRIRLEYDEDDLLDFLRIPKIIRPHLDAANTHEEWKSKLPPLVGPVTADDILNGPLGMEVRSLRERYGYVNYPYPKG